MQHENTNSESESGTPGPSGRVRCCTLCNRPKKGHPRTGCPYVIPVDSVRLQSLRSVQDKAMSASSFGRFSGAKKAEGRRNAVTVLNTVEETQEGPGPPADTMITSLLAKHIPDSGLGDPAYTRVAELRALLGLRSLTVSDLSISASNNWTFRIAGERTMVESWVVDLKRVAWKVDKLTTASASFRGHPPQRMASTTCIVSTFTIGLVTGSVFVFIILAFIY